MFSSLFYFYEAAKDLNFTATARRLYLSQQTLSNHIIRLENYYQVKLFNRKPTLSLTPAGQYLLSYADKVHTDDINIKNSLADLAQSKVGTLRIGASLPRSRFIFPYVIPQFNLEYPHVQIQFYDGLSATLEEQVESGKLDVAIGIFYKPQYNSLFVEKLMQDRVYLVTTDKMLIRYYEEKATEKKKKSLSGIRVSEFKELPLIYPSSHNRLRQSLDMCYAEENCQPNVYFNTRYPQFFFQFCLDSIAACYVTQMGLLSDYQMIKEPVNAFPVLYRDKPISRNVSIIWNKNLYLTQYAKRFIELVKNCTNQLAQTRIL